MFLTRSQAEGGGKGCGLGCENCALQILIASAFGILT
jgi:hypothetical protein